MPLQLVTEWLIRGVTALITQVLGGFWKILGGFINLVGNWEIFLKSWEILSIMLGSGGFWENLGKSKNHAGNWEVLTIRLGIGWKFGALRAQQIDNCQPKTPLKPRNLTVSWIIKKCSMFSFSCLQNISFREALSFIVYTPPGQKGGREIFRRVLGGRVFFHLTISG